VGEGGNTVTEEEWVRSADSLALLRWVTPKATHRKNLLYVCGGCYQISHLFYDPANSLPAVLVGEKAADGKSTSEEERDASWYAECPTFGYDFDPDFVAGLTPEQQCDLKRRLVEKGALSEEVLLGGEWRVDETMRVKFLAAARLAFYCLRSNPFDIPWLFETLQSVDWPGRWLIDCVYSNPFRPVVADPSWLTPTVVALADAIYAERAFDRLPVLADALEEAGCDNADVLSHCRGPGPHVPGCWVVDMVLCKS
jgi:hypothetical protein